MPGWLKRNWHHLFFLATLAGVAVLTYVLVGIGLDPTWQIELKKFPEPIGALIGPFFGLVVLMVGALYNAKITRDRDDRLRKQEAQTLAVALHAELQAAAVTVYRFNQMLKIIAQAAPTSDLNETHRVMAAFQADLPEPSFKVFEANLDRLGLITPKLLTNLIMHIEIARTTVAAHKNPEIVPKLGRAPVDLTNTGRGLLSAARRLGNEAGIKTMTDEYLEAHFEDIPEH